MGLDTSHDCLHGPYSAFGRWRNKIAEIAGYVVWKVKDDGQLGEWPTIMLDWGHISEDNLQGKWDKTPTDPLLVLFAHSDCDGDIYPEQAAPLADRLEELLPFLEGDGVEQIENYREKTQRFIDGLKAAVKANEPVNFH